MYFDNIFYGLCLYVLCGSKYWVFESRIQLLLYCCDALVFADRDRNLVKKKMGLLLIEIVSISSLCMLSGWNFNILL